MKLDLEQPIQSEIITEKEQKKEIKLIGRIKPHPGHTLYQVNVTTLECTEAEFEKSDIKYEDAIKNKKPIVKKVLIKPNCLYISALNRKNVLKILIRDYGLKPLTE